MILPQLKNKLWFFIILVCLFWIKPVWAQSSSLIQTKYQDHYTVNQNRNLTVRKQIELTNLHDDLYVSQYQLSFHNFDQLTGLEVFEDGERAVFSQSNQAKQTTVTIDFQQPAIGLNRGKTIVLQYELTNYVNQSGVYQELLLPLSQESKDENLLDYEVKLTVPKDFVALGISKPRVKKLDSQNFVWPQAQDLNVKALYISFSDKAYYQVDFIYNLFNQAPYDQVLVAALIPDGTFQKAYLQNIVPEPEQVSIDADGNLLAHYRVKAKQGLKINYSGVVELSSIPRTEMGAYQEFFLPKLTTRYLTQENYWAVGKETVAQASLQDLTNSKAIYNYVVNHLEYSFERLNSDLKRQGAQWAWSNPKHAVCMEYTDLFIALAREKGIPSRGVVGYGITEDDQLMPLSFLGDVLHAWPEYFDPARGLWLAIDPTWEDTSGLDYFTSLDLSHIAFVYHGKNPDSPLPPGVYKQNLQDKEIAIKPIKKAPIVNNQWQITWPKTLRFSRNSDHNLITILKAKTNVINYQLKVALQDKSSQQIIASQTVSAMAPLSTQSLEWTLAKDKLTPGSGQTLQFLVNQKVVGEEPYTVLSPFWYFVQNYGFWLLLVMITVGYFLFSKWRS